VASAGMERLYFSVSMERVSSKQNVGSLESYPCRHLSEPRSSRALLCRGFSLQSSWIGIARVLLCLFNKLLFVPINDLVRVLMRGNESDVVNLRPSFL
jgi:hypothetical protein